MLENSSGKLQGREASAFRLACSRILPHPVTICQLPKSVETEDPGREWSADLGQRERKTAPSVRSVRSFSHTLFAGATARDLLGRRPAVPVPALLTLRDQGATCSSGWVPDQAFPLEVKGEPSWLGPIKQQEHTRSWAGQSQYEADGHAELRNPLVRWNSTSHPKSFTDVKAVLYKGHSFVACCSC